MTHSRFDWERSFTSAGLPSRARLVGFALAMHWPNIEPSIARLVDITGLGRRTVIRAIADLEGAGALTTVKAHGRRSRYTPSVPAQKVGALMAPVPPVHRCHEDTGATMAPGGCHGGTPTGAMVAPEETRKRQGRDKGAVGARARVDPPLDSRPTHGSALQDIMARLDKIAPHWRPDTIHRQDQLIRRLRGLLDELGIDKLKQGLDTLAKSDGSIAYPVGALASAARFANSKPIHQPAPKGPSWNATEDVTADWAGIFD